ADMLLAATIGRAPNISECPLLTQSGHRPPTRIGSIGHRFHFSTVMGRPSCLRFARPTWSDRVGNWLLVSSQMKARLAPAAFARDDASLRLSCQPSWVA